MLTKYRRRTPVKSYVFRVELVREEDGRWSAGVPTLPGCATWGYTQEEALQNLHDAVQAYIRDIRKAGGDIHQESTMEIIDDPIVAVSL